MKNGVSEIIGQASFGDGAKTAAYRALRSLICASCGGLIAVGESFTRERQTGQSLRLWPRCQACLPFVLDSNQGSRSALLQSLLTPGAQETPKSLTDREATVSQGEHQQAVAAMRQRLGPALEQARRKRNSK